MESCSWGRSDQAQLHQQKESSLAVKPLIFHVVGRGYLWRSPKHGPLAISDGIKEAATPRLLKRVLLLNGEPIQGAG